MESVTNEQIESVATMLKAILFTDNEQRKVQEAELIKLRTEHPTIIVSCLLSIMTLSPEAPTRALAAVLMRQTVSMFDRSSINAWSLMTPEAKAAFKVALLEVATKETEKGVRLRIADALGEIGATILKSNEDWTELMTYLFKSAITDDVVVVANSLKIFNSLFTYCFDNMVGFTNELYSIFSKTLNTDNLEVKVNTIEAMCSLLSIVETEHCMKFTALLPQMLQTLVAIIQLSEYDAKESMENIIALAESEYKFFKKQLDTVFQFVEHVNGLQIEDLAIKHSALEFFIAIIENAPHLVDNKAEMIHKLVDCIFKLMISVDDDVDETWLKPAEGFQDRDSEQEVEIDYVKLGRKQITKVLSLTEEEGLEAYILSLIFQTIQNDQDWRMKYTALMALSELTNRITEPEKVTEIVTIIQTHVQHTHPKVRYAAYHALGQICEDQEEDFQSAHHATVVPILIAGLQDPVPRVLGHCIACITNFMEGTVHTLAVIYCEQLLPLVINFIVPTQSSIVIEHALTALATIAEQSKEYFVNFYQQIMPLLMNIITNYVQPEYKKLRGRTIECLAIIVTSVGKAQIAPFITQVVQVLLDIQNSTLDYNKDPQTHYLLTAWKKICSVMEADFVPFLPAIMPGLLRLSSIQAEAGISTAGDELVDIQNLMGTEKKEAVNIVTSDIDDKELAIQCLGDMAKHLGAGFDGYIDAANEVLQQSLNYTINEGIRACSASAVAELVKCAKLANRPLESVVAGAKTLIGQLWKIISTEHENETMAAQLEAIKDIIECIEVPFLTQEEVDESGRQIVNILGTSIDRRTRREEFDEEDSDPEDEAFTEFAKEEEDTLHTALSEVLGALFKTHKNMTITIINYFYKDVLSKFLAPTVSHHDHKFAIFIIDDIIEFIGPELVPNEWPAFSEAIIKYCTSKNEAVRQACAYGIGMLAKTSSPEFFAATSNVCLETLKAALQFTPNEEKPWGHAKDNAVAALCKMIKYQFSNIDLPAVMTQFVAELPLKFDKEEAKECHDYFADLFLQRPDLMLQFTGKAIKVFGNILETKYISPETTAKAKALLAQWRDAGLMTEEVAATLNEAEQARLNTLLSS